MSIKEEKTAFHLSERVSNSFSLDEGANKEKIKKSLPTIVKYENKADMSNVDTNSSSITPVLRRSSRPNKGIGKEIFDPSYVPSSQKKYHEWRFDSPNTAQSTSNVYPFVKKARIVVGRGPCRSSVKKEKVNTQEVKKKKVQDSKKIDQVTKLKKEESKRPISIEDFSDDDDNVPLKKLKVEEISETADDLEKDKAENNNESGSDSDTDSDDSYNNPQRLWCICKKPHNNRFMILCDQCEDWFHGDCVGISLQRGKKMEENNEEYVCPKCSKKKTVLDAPYEPNIETNIEEGHVKNSTDVAKLHKRSVALDEKLKSRKSLKGYALLGQIQPKKDSHSKKNSVEDEYNDEQFEDCKNMAKPETTRNVTEALSGRKCIVSSCSNNALPGSVYCSNQCILKHAKESLKFVVKEKENKTEVKGSVEKKDNVSPKAFNPNRRIPVICRKTRKILSGPAAPKRKHLATFFKKYPSFKVYKSHLLSSDQDRKLPKNSIKSDNKHLSTDFYKHVQNQHRKMDRYTDHDQPSTFARKVGESSSWDKKYQMIKSSNQLPSSFYKSNSSTKTSQGHKINKIEQSTNGAIKKVRKEMDNSFKKSESAKSVDRRDSKEMKRKHSTENFKEEKAKRAERSPSSSGKTTKSESKPTMNDIRQNVKKSLFDILKNRSENSEDLKMHPDSIMRLAAKIEDSLFKVYDDTNTKYKTKYRSMMFNLKDSRNPGLWRKVIIGEVTTSEFVQMTAEQMASKKLAEWRKNELTQELDIIKKQEKEIANIRPVAKITHKGEIAIQEDLSDLTENFSLRDGNTGPTIAPARKKRISLSEEDQFDNSGIPLSNDTTSQHNEHLFDHNCKICTGKLKEEDIELNEASRDAGKKVKKSTSIILSSEAQQSNDKLEKNTTPTSHIVISEKIRAEKKKKKKSKKEVESNVNSHDPSLSPTSFLSDLAKEKKKRPILPAPPPLAELNEREPEQSVQIDKTAEKQQKEKNPEKDKNTEKGKKEVANTKKPPESPISPKTSPSPEPPSRSKVSKLIWSGSISMLELRTFKANVYPVNGCCENLDIDLPVRLVLGGRIHPKVVWDYLGKITALSNNYQLSVVRFHAASDDDRVGYVAMLSYFSSRKRFGVVNNQDRILLKDMYLLPLLESHPVPDELIHFSPGITEALTSNRPSMLIGVVIRQVSAMPLQPTNASQKSIKSSTAQRSIAEKKLFETEIEEMDEEEEYIPDNDPPIKEKSSPGPLLTDEELAAKSEVKPKTPGSLLERNRSLAPSLRFFMRKQSEEEQSRRELEVNNVVDDDDDHDDDDDDNRPYSPSEDLIKEEEDTSDVYDPEEGIVQDEEEEPYDPEKMFPDEGDEEEYDPETAFPPLSSENDENIPYDPEDDDNLIEDSRESNEVKELVEKQAFIERMQRELEEKKAKLAQVEQSLQKTAVTTASVAEKPRIVDPRLAKRAAQVAGKPEEKAANIIPNKLSTVVSSGAPSSVSISLASPSTASTSRETFSASSSLTSSTVSDTSCKPSTTEIESKPVIAFSVSTPSTTITGSKPPSDVVAPKLSNEIGKKNEPAKTVDPLQTILSVLNMAQTKNVPTSSSVAGALKVFQKHSSPLPLPDSTIKPDPEDADTTNRDGSKEVTSDNVLSPRHHSDDEVEHKKLKKGDHKRHRSSSASSSSSREDSRNNHRRDHDDKRHGKRHKRSRSRSPHRHGRHSPRHHEQRRHQDRSWNRDKRR